MDRHTELSIPLTCRSSPDPSREKDTTKLTGQDLEHPHQPAHLSFPEDTRTKEKKEEEEEKMEEKEEKEKEEEEYWQTKRIVWSSKREYILSTIGYCVGLGNLFRFPYLCERNGGGAFLIPFVMSLLLIGLPLFAMEVVLGQFSARNALQMWSISPIFKGAGVGMVIASSLCFWYQNSVMSWGIYYLVCSFWSEVPWALCDQWWNTPQCFTYALDEHSSSMAENTSSVLGMSSSVFENASLGMSNNVVSNDTVGRNLTDLESDVTPTIKVSAAEEFFERHVLQLSSGFDSAGTVVWHLALTLTLTLFFCFCALVKGIRSSGKIVYVTATLPYILLTILLVRGATLPGAVDGILFYIRPDFAKLLEPQVWVEAAVQIFFSLGPAWGGLIVMASYNKFHNNCLRDSVILTLVSEGTSVYGGFVIFSMLGYMAHVSGQDIDKVVSAGPGLMFILYPEAVALMPLSQLWAVLFFCVVITLGIDSQITNAEVGLTTIIDHFPRTLLRRRPLVTAVFCSFFLVISLPFVMQGGMYVVQLVDWFVAALSVMIIGFIECLVVGWIYGIPRFGDDIYLMIGRRPPSIFCVFWRYITPLLLLVLLIATFVNYTPPTLGDYVYGPGATSFGWCVAVSSFIPIPVFALYQLRKAEGSLVQRLRQTLKPDYNVWKPADPVARVSYCQETQKHIDV
ncbi:sodium- and chloride-dependent GABA transporter 1-like [Babylonia areolata]|uniref:sodium- and chloride-dependent GABA transporter 1-like n=1 Tax=Babylonia areolata TaxID=304850 RepID=UPI003FD4383E